MDASKPRKACDLCYRRKIKCDGGSPRCSHCVVYKSECTYLAASRKKKKKIVASREATDTQSDSSSSSRVEALEARLRAALEENNTLKQHQQHDTRIVHNDETPVEKEAEVFSSRGQLDLPPEDVVLPLIQTYLSTFNCFFPLFDTPTLVKIVHNWYHSPSQRTSTTWASIYIAMALAQYQASQSPHSEVSVVDCLRKAQSVLSEIIISDAELTSVQVVLGLVLLFIGSPDPRPSTVLLATAIKLVHTMRLHRQEGYSGLPDSEVLQRRRVFWIAYILDREISLRVRQPPIQHDSEIDVDLPSDTVDADGAGFITAIWSQETFNFFRARVQLAQMQGQVYDCVYSVAAQHLAPETQAIKALEVRQAMRSWRGRIPLDFSPEVLSHDSTTILPQYFCQLYSPYVACLGQLCQATSMDPPWVESLLSYARSVTAGAPCEPPKVPEGWDTLVDASRSVMNLFMSVQHKEPAFIWSNVCTYSSGLVCLSANAILEIGSSFPDLDLHLKDTALAFIDQLSRQANHEGLKQVQRACVELNSHIGSVEMSRVFDPQLVT